MHGASDYLIISNRMTSCASWFRSPEELTKYLSAYEPGTFKRLIFVFWSWKVPDSLLSQYKCYGFHTGPLLEGKGRGGSPIDNLQKLGVKMTTLCCFEMNEVIDGGKVKLAVPLGLEGTKEEVILRIETLVPEMCSYILVDQPEIPETFKRIQ